MTSRVLEKREYERFNLVTPFTFPAKDQPPQKSGHKFFGKDQDNVYDWYNAFSVLISNSKLSQIAKILMLTHSHQRSFFFLTKKNMTVKSAGKPVYEAVGIHKVIFIKTLLDFSNDYTKSTAKAELWYVESDTTTVTADDATISGIRQRDLLSHGGALFKALIPLDRSSFYKELSDKLLPPI